MRQNKGFVFTLDTLLGVIVLAMFLVSFSFFSSQTSESPYPLLLLNKQAYDVLAVLDKTEKLGTLDADIIAESLNETLQESFSWNMQIEYYNKSAGLQHVGNFTFGSDYGDVNRIVVAERMFIVFENQTGPDEKVEYYGTARLRLWRE